MRPQVAACHKGAQQALAHAVLYLGLHLGKGDLVDLGGVKRDRLHTGGQRLKHPIDHAHMEMHMRVQVGTEPVNKGNCAQAQADGVTLCSTGAMGLQALLHRAQENVQRGIECAFVTLQVVANALRDRQHPLAHRQARKHVVAQVGGCLGHAACVA
jgi:hypothetical protein